METEPWELPARVPAAAPPSPAHGLATGTPAEPWELPSRSVHDVSTEPVPLPPGDASPDAAPGVAAAGVAAVRVAEPPSEASSWTEPSVYSARPLVRHPRRRPRVRGVPVAALLVVALVTLGAAAWLARQMGGDAGREADTSSVSGRPGGPSAGAARGSGVVAGASTTRSPQPGGTAEARPQNLRGLVARVRVPATAPAARDASGITVTYTSAHLLDGDPSTAWRMRGDGRGRTITLTFSRPVRLARVGLVNGYAKVDPSSGTDRYSQQRRVTRVAWRAGRAAPVPQKLVDGVRTPQAIALATPPIRTLTVTIVTTVRGAPRFDYTALGEIELEGH